MPIPPWCNKIKAQMILIAEESGLLSSNPGDADELPSTQENLLQKGQSHRPFNSSFRPHAGLLEDKVLTNL